MKAMIVNRFGDFGIYFSLLLIFFFFKSFDFSIVFGLSQLVAVRSVLNFLSYTASGVDLICFFLFLGAVGKSAQLGLHT
jgi:NADH:ubiquinone oxidoreductase subunit 5 (subunit L)/multisubunit Na+/H+ antiporter MnhA subunit